MAVWLLINCCCQKSQVVRCLIYETRFIERCVLNIICTTYHILMCGGVKVYEIFSNMRINLKLNHLNIAKGKGDPI